MVGSASTLAVYVSIASGYALGSVFGAQEVWEGLGVFGSIWRQAVSADTVVCEGGLVLISTNHLSQDYQVDAMLSSCVGHDIVSDQGSSPLVKSIIIFQQILWSKKEPRDSKLKFGTYSITVICCCCG